MISFLHFSISFYHLVVFFELCEHHVLVHVLVLDYYAAEWFGSVWVFTPENQTDVGLISCRCDAVSGWFGSGF
jgi:hypothetical protein